MSHALCCVTGSCVEVAPVPLTPQVRLTRILFSKMPSFSVLGL